MAADRNFGSLPSCTRHQGADVSDLVKSLRDNADCLEQDEQSTSSQVRVMHEAADALEAYEANKRTQSELFEQFRAAYINTEKKLKGAIEALEAISKHHSWSCEVAREALARIKGEK